PRKISRARRAALGGLFRAARAARRDGLRPRDARRRLDADRGGNRVSDGAELSVCERRALQAELLDERLRPAGARIDAGAGGGRRAAALERASVNAAVPVVGAPA